jgi:hypothetical protein
VLDSVIEAQIHESIRLDRDIETLAADPAFAAQRYHDSRSALPEWMEF